MILIGLFFIYLAVAKEFEPMLLIPIGFGILIGNIPFNMEAGLKVGIYEEGSVLNNTLHWHPMAGWAFHPVVRTAGAIFLSSKLAPNLMGAIAVSPIHTWHWYGYPAAYHASAH